MSNDEAKDISLSHTFRRFIEEAEFPCVGAKAALTRGQIDFAFAQDIRSNWNDTVIARKLRAFAKAYKAAPDIFRSFVVLFHATECLPEAEFERHLWARLQSLSDKDSFCGTDADPRVTSDPSDDNFGLSFGGEGFFIVGLHPGASRPARRFSHAALAFNAHEQFTRLRDQNQYERMRETIIARDVKIAGSPNPMLARHGETSEARQYSGRSVSSDWRCPFVAGGDAITLDTEEGTLACEPREIAPRTGTAFCLSRGDHLTVIDPFGEQVADLLAFNRHDVEEVVSSGRTLDYASRIFLTKGDPLYSNRSNVMLRITEDTVGRHDFLLTPCSRDTFRIIYGDENPHRGCFGNFATALAPFGISADRIPVAFNCFMNVRVNGETGVLRVDPPLSKAGDHITFVAEMDLVIGLTACSALQSNNGSFKPIRYSIKRCAD